ncbi:endonuclease domain-containing protein [Kutzneria sp. CA-103260]|uniref:endonuclease domain-containing protein n=1 Tax=Kutzneria sp. CA-103260 TaxID=2802641 RepID=UPI001BAD9669|nr:DUF559 domain-containing protein [Kutzneria sp. CA-103260]QUQ70869.1 hypothetical protein JJ691_86520 [Kutzneria sp. CA-103260]
MTELPDGLHGAYRRPELEAAIGLSDLRAAIREGRLVASHRRVLVVRERIADLETRAAAGLLFAGDDAVLTRHTAARLYGCTAANTAPIDILVPYSRRLYQSQGLAIHNGAFVDEDDVAEVSGLRVLVPDMVLADLLCRGYQPAALACADQMLARLPDAGRAGFRELVLRRIRERKDPRGQKRAGVLLNLATGLPESPFESQLVLTFYDHDLPLATPQHSITTIDGRELYRLDFAWPEFRIAVEYDGYAAHAERQERDRLRDEDLARRGWIVIRAAVADLMTPRRLIDEIRDAFRTRRIVA